MSDSNDYDSDSVAEEVDDVSGSESEEEVVVKPVKKRKGKNAKDPNKPKRNMSAFFLYSQAFRAQVKSENPDAPFGDIARILSAQFKALPEKEAKKWEKKAEKDKARYQEEMKGYTAPSDDEEEPAAKKKGKKAKKDPNAPKRNMSAYFLYSVSIRSEVKKENPEASFGDIAKIISQQFKALAEKERKKWDKKAELDKQRYQEELAAYNA